MRSPFRDDFNKMTFVLLSFLKPHLVAEGEFRVLLVTFLFVLWTLGHVTSSAFIRQGRARSEPLLWMVLKAWLEARKYWIQALQSKFPLVLRPWAES